MKGLELLPTGSNWKKVLLAIYSYSPHSYGESHKLSFYDNNHPLAKILKISGYELGLAISFLREQNLIKDNNKKKGPLDSEQINPEWGNVIFLTKDGFEIVAKLENQLSNQKLQHLIILFTGIATLTGLIIFIKEIFKVENSINFSIYIIGILFIVFLIYREEVKKSLKKFILRRNKII